jgi:hypothetical protein
MQLLATSIQLTKGDDPHSDHNTELDSRLVVVDLIRFFKFYGNCAVRDISTQTRSGRCAKLVAKMCTRSVTSRGVTALDNGNPGRKLLSRRRVVCIGAAAVASDAPARSISIEILKCAHLRPRDVAWGFHMMELGTRQGPIR